MDGDFTAKFHNFTQIKRKKKGRVNLPYPMSNVHKFPPPPLW